MVGVDVVSSVVVVVVGDELVVVSSLVAVVDDEAAHGEDQRLLGPLVGELLAEAGFHVDAAVVVSGDEVEIRNALNTAVIGGVDLVVSVGGVGVGARDVTPEATEPLLDRRLRGIPAPNECPGR